MLTDYFFKFLSEFYGATRTLCNYGLRVAVKDCDVRRIRESIADMRFLLARMDDLCYKIEQEQAEEVI